jgi:hypothetical protein
MPARYVNDLQEMRAIARSDMSQSWLDSSTLLSNSAQRKEGPRHADAKHR